MRARDTLRLWLPLVFLLAACSGGATASATPGGGTPAPTAEPGSPAPSPSAATSAALLLRVTTEGGFIGPAANLAALPQVSVYADGRILMPGAVDAIYPGPLLIPVQVRDVGPAGAQAIVTAIRAAGLDKPRADTGGGIPADTGTTVFQVQVDATAVTTRLVLGGGLPGHPGGGDASPDPEVAAAADLLTKLNDSNETWGAASAPTTTLQPTAFRIYVAPGAPPSDPSTAQAPVVWPLSTPLASFGVPATPDRGIAGLRQGAVLGADAQTLLPILNQATVLTPFSSGGHLYTLYVRLLLPDEVPAQG